MSEQQTQIRTRARLLRRGIKAAAIIAGGGGTLSAGLTFACIAVNDIMERISQDTT